ncbi:MAG: hypothetical protein HZB92_03110 [Euryarchaeota archaeon]|nr:hypothetical protein [Euryarchaeota archaeon]
MHLSRSETACRCRRCGTAVKVLPDDRRMGYCFDCFDPIDVKVTNPPKVIMRCRVGTR